MYNTISATKTLYSKYVVLFFRKGKRNTMEDSISNISPSKMTKTKTPNRNRKTSLDSYTSRNEFRGGGGGYLGSSTTNSTMITVIYLLIFVIYPGRGSAETSCSNVPKRLTNGHCECGFMPPPNHKLLSLVCKGLNASDMFSALHSRPNTLKSNEHPHRIVKDGKKFSSQKNSILSDKILSEEESTWMIAKSSVGEVIVTESDIKCVDLDHFVYFTSLRKLVIANSKVTKLDDCDIDKGNQYKSETPSTMLNFLTHLDLSNNAIKSIELRALEQAKNLKTINLSNNMLQHLDDIFTNSKFLEELNLSSNKLDARVDRVVFTDLPSSLKSLDISGWYQIIHYLLYLAII